MGSRLLHLAIDGRELAGRRTGVGRYVLELLRSWSAADRPHRYTVAMAAEPGPELRALGGAISWMVSPAAVAGTRWEQTVLPRLLARARPDAFLAPAYTAPLRLPCPMAVVVHDVSYFAHPEWFGWREGWRRRLLTRATARRAAGILTVSTFARDEIAKHLKIAPSRVVLAPPGAPSRRPDLPTERKPLILYVGSLFNRRRIPEILRAFAQVRSRLQDARLALVGDNRTSPRIDPRVVAAQLGIADRVSWLEYVDDATRDALYREARGFVFISDYEGFGMPPLEALAFGVPPIVLDTPVSREIYGDAALRVPLDERALADAMTTVLTDIDVRSRLLAAGHERLAAYSWPRTAGIVLGVLEQIAR